MSPLFFIIRRSIVNAIKGLAKKPAALIAYIVLAVFFLGMLVMIFVMPQGSLGAKDPALFRSIVTALTIVVYYFSIRQGIEKGSSMFRAPDVNFVFAGPFRPNDALLYGFIKQMGSMLLVLFVAAFQIPNLKNNFALRPEGVGVIILAVAIYALSYPLLGMTIYAFTSKSRARKRLVSGLLNAAAFVVLALVVYNLYMTRDLARGFYAVFDSSFFTYFPVIGWMKSIAAAAVDGIGLPFIVGLALMLASIAAFVAILYRLNLDYYEEVLAATEYREAAIAAKKEGKSMQFATKARRKVRQPIYGRGAAVLFGKNMLEMRKSAFILFFDRTSLIIIAAALVFKFIMPSEPFINNNAMLFVLYFSVYMLFLLQMQGRWPAELGRHFIFTLPARPAEKLFFVTASDHIKNAIDGLALFGIAGVVFGRSPWLVVACILTYTLLGAVFIYGDVMARRVFGGVHSKPLLIFLKMFLTVFVVAPGIAAAIVSYIVFKTELASVAAFGLWACVAASGVFAISAGIFKNIEASA
jgi:hypothetical protein